MTINEIRQNNFENIKKIAKQENNETLTIVFSFENNNEQKFAFSNTIENKAIFAKLKADFETAKKSRLNKKTIYTCDMTARIQALNEKMQNDILDCTAKLASYQKQLEKINEKIATAKKYLALSDDEKIAYINDLTARNEKTAYMTAKRENASRPFARDIFQTIATAYGLKMRDIQKCYLSGLDGVFDSDFAKSIFAQADEKITAYMTK